MTMPNHLTKEQMQSIRDMCPPNSHVVLIIANKDGTTIDTTISHGLLLPFLAETVSHMNTDSLIRDESHIDVRRN